MKCLTRNILFEIRHMTVLGLIILLMSFAPIEMAAYATNGVSLRDITVNKRLPGQRGSFISQKNIFLPPSERNKTVEDTGPSIEEDQFLQRYILYGTIKAGDYSVALMKVNPKKRRDVPKKIRDKTIIRLHPGESLEGYVLKAVGDESAIFDKNGKKIRIKTFDIDKKPERQTKISVAQATPKIRPESTPLPTTRPNTVPTLPSRPANQHGSKAIRPTKNIPSPRSSVKPRSTSTPSNANQSPTTPQTPVNNPFLRALKGVSTNKGTKSLPSFNPFLKLK